MKKIAAILVCIMVITAFALVFSGCESYDFKGEFGDNLVKEISRDGDNYVVKLKEKTYVDTVVLEENKDKTECVVIYASDDNGNWQVVYKQDRIDKYRVCVLDGVVTDKLMVSILEKSGNTKINNIEVYNGAATKREKEFKVTEYLTTEKGKLESNVNNPDFTGYFNVVDDIILIGEIYLDKNGNIVYGEGEDDWRQDIAYLRQIKKDINIVVDINIKAKVGEKNSEVMDMINGNIDNIVKNVIAFTEKHGIDAIDFDWEYPENQKQWNAYSLLLTRLGAALKEKGKYLTIAVAPWGAKLSKEACDAVEYVNLMMYDMFDERGEHASFYHTTKYYLEEFIKKTHFTKEKVMLGLSFYGRTLNGSANAWPDMNWDYRNNHASMGKWGNYVYDFPYSEDGVTKYATGYINGYAMNRDKTAYAINAGLGGVMIFRMVCDAPYSYEYSLHRAVEETIAARCA